MLLNAIQLRHFFCNGLLRHQSNQHGVIAGNVSVFQSVEYRDNQFV